MVGGWVCFMTNRRDGILYVGVTSNSLLQSITVVWDLL
jgi:hypothetical protein